MEKGEGTKVYGCGDDLIEFEGDVYGEVNHYGTDDADETKGGCLVVFSDGTVLSIHYGKGPLAIWGIAVVRKGELLIGIEQCDNEYADSYSDAATFKPGLKWACAAKKWERVT